MVYFLNVLKVRVNQSTVISTLQDHPDWPSLLCISDSLRKWNVPNAVGKIDPEHIDQIPVPFMIYRGQMEIVTHVDDKDVSLFSNGLNKVESKKVFSKKWNGIYLIAEKTNISGEKDYSMVKRNMLIKRVIPTGLILLLLTFSSLMFGRNIAVSSSLPLMATILQYIVLLLGIGIRVFYYGMKSTVIILY